MQVAATSVSFFPPSDVEHKISTEEGRSNNQDNPETEIKFLEEARVLCNFE